MRTRSALSCPALIQVTASVGGCDAGLPVPRTALRLLAPLGPAAGHDSGDRLADGGLPQDAFDRRPALRDDAPLRRSGSGLGWAIRHRRFDLITGMLLPYVTVTSLIVIACACTIHSTAFAPEQILPAVLTRSPKGPGRQAGLLETTCKGPT